MDLFENPDPAFTRWVIENGLLPSRFVLVDVGCQGGEHQRWRWLGDQLELHAFDALEEAIQELREKTRAPNKQYYSFALGNEDAERELFVQENAYATSFYQQGDNSRMSVDASAYTNRSRRIVAVRKLDSLFAEGVLTRADFVKIDCEGFEPEILKGAQEFLRATRPVGVESETSFNISPLMTHSHMFAIYEQLVDHQLILFDLAFDRAPRGAFTDAFGGRRFPGLGQPGTFNVLFARDLVTERDFPTSYSVPHYNELATVDRVIKAAIIFELYGLIDCAYEAILQFATVLPESFDTEKALTLLRTIPSQGDDGTLGPRTGIEALHNSTSWKLTAPLRAISTWLPHGLRRAMSALRR